VNGVNIIGVKNVEIEILKTWQKQYIVNVE